MYLSIYIQFSIFPYWGPCQCSAFALLSIAFALLGVSIFGAAPPPPDKENDVSASLRFNKTQLELVLNVFGELTGRSIIRPANLPQVVFDFKPQGFMTEKDAVERRVGVREGGRSEGLSEERGKRWSGASSERGWTGPKTRRCMVARSRPRTLS